MARKPQATMSLFVMLSVALLAVFDTALAFDPFKAGDIITVAGASGRVGARAVARVLELYPEATVRAVARDGKRAKSVLPASDRVQIVQADLKEAKGIAAAVDGCNALIWCATGFSDASAPLQRIANLFGFFAQPTAVIDRAGVEAAAARLAASGAADGSTLPKFVLLSSAAVTRPTWSAAEKAAFAEAATIPIVKLNPFKILDLKREGEEALQKSGVPYCIVRACGLNDKHPHGRPVLSSGDIASGRINRADVADLLARLLGEEAASGKSFEAFSLPGLDGEVEAGAGTAAAAAAVQPLAPALERLPTDAAAAAADPSASLAARVAAYAVLSQLTPAVLGQGPPPATPS